MYTCVKITLSAVVASVGAAALAITPTAAADTTLVLFEHDTMQHQTDLGAPGPGPNDQFLFAGDVYDRPGGMFLGTAGGSCTDLSSNDGAEQAVCNATLNLAGGQIVVQGAGDMGAGDTHPLSVVGGTGSYQNVRGNGTVRIPPDVPNQTDAHFVLNLTGV